MTPERGDDFSKGVYSRKDMVREFGETGVQNPNVVDLIERGEGRENVVLSMYERRRWRGLAQLKEIEEKINRYLGYALDGYLLEQFPQYENHSVTIRLCCVEEPAGEPVEFLEAARRAVEAAGLRFEVAVGPVPD